uniref:DNA polymerase n=1 Tax=Trypanosoma congolense (strain IL3000) TaxID=1068625 RepID=G0URV3_TRYCI|nr:putative DNA polymerase zeta catalytic subunit [Trypanosoma congolense IL3000]
MQSSLPLTTSSVECVDKCGDEMFWEFKTRGSWLRPSHIIGDISRNFLWTYNHQRKQVRVSGVTWPSTAPVPLSPPLPPQPKSTASGWPRNSIPFLTHIAKSQDLPRAESEQTAQHGRGSRRAGARNICGSQKDITRIPCTFRIMVLEAFIHRRCGVQHVEEEYLLAVGLGRTASSEESVGVRLLCVASESQVSCAAAHALQRFSGSVELVYVPSERDLLLCVMRELRNYDPDIVMSWEVGRGGVGLFALRYQALLQRSFSNDFSRLTTDDSFLDVGDLGNATGLGQSPGDTINEEPCGDGDENALLSTTSSLQTPSSASPSSESSSFSTCGGATTAKMDAGMPVSGNAAVAGRVTVGDMTRQLSRRFGGNPRAAGRFIIDLSKYLRKALQLPSYTLQMVYLKLFNKTIPFFTDIALTKMYSCGDPGTRHVFLSVLLTRVVAQHRIAQHLQFYSRTSEFARMFGILFNEVVTRGSQYHVEATLYRMAKPMGFTMLSPPASVVHQQPRLQSMPLTMEPRSGFYKDDPVVVLDFRSLYPSIVIAYNICYTTCLGIVGKRNYGRLGVLTSYRQDDSLILSLLDRDESRNAASCTDGDEGDDTSKWSHSVTFAPNGTMFLTRETREGVLPQMLRVLLDTRVDVKAAIERVAKPHGDVYMQQILEKQQLALKMLANTTYGYTAASFTGRMPCADVADAIVMLGRQTLERAIMLINGHPTWKAEVVYGDTDSVFVRLPGRSKEEAFAFGEEIAKEVTAVNPFPVCLQLEKVLKPCLLLVKKRYVGYAYFKPDQKEPQFLDKGIETVRRDQCAATSRLAAKMLHLLFSGADSAVLRRCFYEELSKLQRGDCSPADCIFRRAVKLGRYKSGSELPPAAHLAMQLIDGDVMKVPYWGERVPFVVVKKPESSRLRDRVVHPQRLLSATEHFVIDSEYYIKRNIIPTLERMFYLNGISFTRWYQEMPRRRTYRNYFDLSLSTFSSVSSKRQRDSDKPSPVDARRGEGSGHGDGVAKGINMHTSKGRGDVDAPRGGRSRRADKITLDHFFQPSLCAVCLVNSSKTTSPSPPVCKECLDKPSATMLRVVGRRCRVERRLHLVKTACLRCIGTCGERGGQGFLGGQQADVEDMNFVIPHELAITGSCAGDDRVRGAMSSVGAQAQLRRQPVRNNECWEEDVRCVSIDCHVSFEKKRLESLYPQLISLENFLSLVLSQSSTG